MHKWIRKVLLVLFAALFLFSAAMLLNYYRGSRTEQTRYQELSGLRSQQNNNPIPNQSGDTVSESIEVETVTVTDPKTGAERQILAEFSQLYALNSDIIGWLTVPGCEIDYPVMHTPEDPEFYLRRNFDKKSQTRGCLFIQAECDAFTPSDNITIYGHRMRDKTMFGQLEKYRKPEFRNENPYIYFDTLKEKHTYEVMTVFLTTATKGEGFAYHRFIDAETEKDFEDFVAGIQEIALYDTGITASYGDKLICLSTCEYSQTNGRLVVVAKQIA